MKKPILLLGIFFSFGILYAKAQSNLPFSKSSFLNYLQQLRADSMVIVGQHVGDAAATVSGFQTYVEDLSKLTGKFPALIGIEYGMSPNNDLPLINTFVKRYAKNDGLVTMSWHADNPFTDGYNCRWNSIAKKDSINFNSLLKSAPESKAKQNYRNELMHVGAALKELKEAGIIVLWRPFHEMNGSWFWWGTNDFENPSNTRDYVQLWNDMFSTFTNDLGLDNLIWVYSPFVSAKWVSSFDAFYPGPEKVDIVGVDIYSKVPEFVDYPVMQKYGKPVVIAEIGPVKEAYGNYDELQMLKVLRGKASWFLQWSSWKGAKVAIIDNLRFMEMMHHPSAITFDKLKIPEN